MDQFRWGLNIFNFNANIYSFYRIYRLFYNIQLCVYQLLWTIYKPVTRGHQPDILRLSWKTESGFGYINRTSSPIDRVVYLYEQLSSLKYSTNNSGLHVNPKLVYICMPTVCDMNINWGTRRADEWGGTTSDRRPLLYIYIFDRLCFKFNVNYVRRLGPIIRSFGRHSSIIIRMLGSIRWSVGPSTYS